MNIIYFKIFEWKFFGEENPYSVLSVNMINILRVILINKL
jgi:hypothetical protein